MQDARDAAKGLVAFHKLMREILADVRAKDARGELHPDTVAARLCHVTDPATGKPLPDDYILPEFAVTFLGGAVHTSPVIVFMASLYHLCISFWNFELLPLLYSFREKGGGG